MRSSTQTWFWKAVMLSITVLLATASLTWAQDYSAFEKDPSTITVVPLTPEGGNRAVGDDCTNPIIVSVPSALPYNNTNYTCGRGNTYNLGSSSCMYYYSGGEDIIYRLDATANVMITLTMNPLGTTWTGIGIFLGCPNTGTCLGAAYNSGSNNNVIPNVSLTAGNSYYVMLDTWPSPNCIPSFNLTIVNSTPVYTPVNSFPFLATFETGTMPAQLWPLTNTYSQIGVTSAAAYSGSYGERSMGGTSTTGWTTATTGDAAFNNVSHVAKTHIQVVPSGQAGFLKLRFHHKMTYAYADPNYSWFRVTVNGTPVADVNGTIYPRPGTPNSDAFIWREYNLSAYQNSGPFIISLETACRVYAGYTTTYPWGDCSYLDNVEVYYDLPPGNIEGYVFNYYGLAISGATIGVQNGPQTTSGPDGHYLLTGVQAGNITVYCVKEGYNPASAVIAVPTGATTTYNWTLTQPSMVVNPLYIEETLNPGEYFTTSVNVLNNGTGPLGWEAEVVYPEDAPGTTINPAGYEPEAVQPNGPASTGYGTMTDNGNRDLMLCPEGSLFSIVPQGSTNAYTSTLAAGYKCYQSYSGVENDISTVTFWGVFAGYTLPAAPGPFLIELRQPGGSPGAVVTTVTAQLQGVNTGQMLLGSYQIGVFTAEVPATTLPAGWLSVQWTSSPTFYWLNTMAGSGFPAMQNTVSLTERLAMCLSGSSSSIGDWLTMDYYDGTTPGFGGVSNIPTHLDASGTEPGQVFTASIVFTSDPNVGTITVPVTMIIMGTPIVAPENLEVELTDDVNGAVTLTWEWNGDAFQFFMIKRDGVVVGTTTSLSYVDMLPDYGEYCYTVQAVYDEGQSAPAGPECVEWPNPNIFVDPNDLHGWVWVGQTVDVYTTIYNNGEGTLAYTFPEFAALDLINNPNIQHNQTGTPEGLRSISPDKGDESANNQGYPVVLGAGGPDDFGYIWIDSDEDGGPTYNWIDISATGIAVPLATLGDDGKAGPYPIGFNFEYYGENKTQFWVASNGCVGFNSNYQTYTNTGIPTGNASYVDFIALFWDDLYSTYAGVGIWYQNFTDYTVVQWNDAQRLGAAGQTMDMQAIIYKNGKIKIQYKDINSFNLTSGTIGIQSSDPGLGLQVSFNTSYVHNNLALLFSLPADFIIDVEPAWGTVASGDEQPITITYDAQDYEPGEYTQELLLESNDPDTPEWTVFNTMHVYVPAQFAGIVVDNDGGAGLGGVTVTAGEFQTNTDDNGNYSLYVDEGNYNVVFTKLGYQTVTVADTFALAGVVTPINIGMWDNNYAPAFVTATVQDNDTWCLVEWALPEGPYEIGMDDGEADDFFVYAQGGSWSAVKFTPAGYPANVIGGKFYVGDGSFPGPFLGTEFGVAIFAADGPNGLPGTMLDSTGVTVNNYGWVSLDWMNATIESGDFYLAMFQVGNAPDAAPIGIDTDNPTYFRSYSKFGGLGWSLSAFQDFMIRAWVSGPEGEGITTDAVSHNWKATPKILEAWKKHGMTQSGTIPHILPGYERNDMAYRGVEGMSNRDVQNYRVGRYSDFNPNGSPAAGTLTELATTGNLSYNDYAWAGLSQGWYAYGVKALYTSGQYSDWAISNIVGHLMDFQVTVNCTLSTGLEPSGVEVTLQGNEYPYETYFAVTPASGTVVFPAVWKGHYDVIAFKIGYDTYIIDNTFINADKVFNIMLSEKKYAPTCLYVDPKTLDATWCEPLRTALEQNFEGADFPPAGWQMTTNGEGWYRTDDGSSSSWIIPAWDSFYAVSNDDGAGSTNPGEADYLITPPVDLRESDGYALMFNSFYDGAYGQLAFVEFSLDGGATWEVLSQMTPSSSWADITIDLAQFSGANGPAQVWLAFHSDDAGAYASGWAVDNVKVQVPAPPASYLDFYVFLDDAFEGTTTETAWNYAPLTYGQTYTASVAARYSSGLSAKDYYTFTCTYLYPPRNLVGVAPDDAAILLWDPPLEGVTGAALVSEEPRKEFPNVNSEYSPTVRTVEGTTAQRDAWDLQLAFGTANNGGEAGAESDGAFYYTSMWNGNGFQKYNLDGSYVGPVTVGSINGIRDIAYDPTTEHMFGGAAANTVYEWEFENNTQVGTINAPTAVRAIAYDPDFDGFWANNWSTTITLFDKEGTQLNSFPVGAHGNYYGFAHDEWTDGGPYLWGYSQDGSGNVIVQIDIATGQETGFTYDVSGILVLGSGIAGGLFTHPNLYTGTVSIGGNSQNDTYFVYELAPYSGGGPSGDVPENLLGYNIYRDGDFQWYQDHVGSYTNPEPQQGIDEGLQPGVYAYGVTAVYDLAPYGFPGETDESKVEGPAIVTVDYCYDLEFNETWALGNFDANNWLTDGTNWTVNGQVGNPAPSAEFTWDPIQTDYMQSLESYPLCAVGMTEGKIWLDFDVALESFQPTGEEMLLAEVWNWDSQTWSPVATFTNVDGSFDWTSQHINIKALAMDKVFKIRFHAMGVNSLNIVGWNIDNIHVYRTCDAPENLTSSLNYPEQGINLNWDAPAGSSIDEWIHWDDGTNYDAIGTGGAVEFDVAARWDASQLVTFEGASVTEVAFFPNEAAATYNVRVWIGAGAANLVVDQPVSNPLIGQWNYVALTTPVPIDVTQELWVGYYVNAQTGYPAGCDDGPAIDGYGNMMNFGGWQTLLQINPDLDYNWNIQVHVQTAAGASMPLTITQKEIAAPQGAILSLNPVHPNTHPVFAGNSNGTRELTGFNIYRSIDGGDYELIDFTAETTYTDADLTNGLYCYMVSAVWASETDQCESAFSNETCEILNVGIFDPNASATTFSMYPNPANDHVFITTSGDLKRVTVYNALGQLVKDEIVTGKQYELETTSYTIGVYMVRVETGNGVNTRTLTIQR